MDTFETLVNKTVNKYGYDRQINVDSHLMNTFLKEFKVRFAANPIIESYNEEEKTAEIQRILENGLWGVVNNQQDIEYLETDFSQLVEKYYHCIKLRIAFGYYNAPKSTQEDCFQYIIEKMYNSKFKENYSLKRGFFSIYLRMFIRGRILDFANRLNNRRNKEVSSERKTSTAGSNSDDTLTALDLPILEGSVVESVKLFIKSLKSNTKFKFAWILYLLHADKSVSTQVIERIEKLTQLDCTIEFKNSVLNIIRTVSDKDHLVFNSLAEAFNLMPKMEDINSSSLRRMYDRKINDLIEFMKYNHILIEAGVIERLELIEKQKKKEEEGKKKVANRKKRTAAENHFINWIAKSFIEHYLSEPTPGGSASSG